MDKLPMIFEILSLIRDETIHNFIHPLLLLTFSSTIYFQFNYGSTLGQIVACSVVAVLCHLWGLVLTKRSIATDQEVSRNVTYMPALLLGIPNQHRKHKDLLPSSSLPIFRSLKSLGDGGEIAVTNQKESSTVSESKVPSVAPSSRSAMTTSDLSKVGVKTESYAPVEAGSVVGTVSQSSSSSDSKPPVTLKFSMSEEVDETLKTMKDYVVVALGDKVKDENLESFMWLNTVIQRLWQSIRAAVEDIIVNIVWPEVSKELKDLPVPIVIEIYNLSLGMVAPQFKKIEVMEFRNDNIILDLDISYPSEANARVKVKTDVIPSVTLSLNSIFVSIKVRVVVHSLQPKEPFCRAFSVFLRSSPLVDWDLGGLAKVANYSYIDKLIKSIIDENVLMLVTPNKFTFPLSMIPLPPDIVKFLGQENLDACRNEIIPNPHGIVKIHIERAENLPATDLTSSLLKPKMLFTRPQEFFKKLWPKTRSTDAYIVLKVGGSKFKTKTVDTTLNPVYNFVVEIPVQYPTGVELEILFYDNDAAQRDKLIGYIKEKIEFISETCAGTQDLRWQGINDTRGRALLSYQWIPQQLVESMDEWQGQGIVGFSVTALDSDSPVKPEIIVKIIQKEDVEDSSPTINTKREWKSFLPTKELANYKLCTFVEKEWDMFLLQGGMLRFQPNDQYIYVEVKDLLQRKNEVGFRVWKGQCSISDAIKSSIDKEPLGLSLEKTFTKDQTVVNKFFKRLGREKDKMLHIRVPDLMGGEGDFLTLFIQFGVYFDADPYR